MRALVTGSSGFVGRHLTAKLKAAGYEVIEIDTRHERFPTDMRWYLRVGVKEEFDVIVHCAANILDIDQRVKGKLDCYQDLELDYLMCKYVEANPPKKCFVAMSSCAAQFPVEEDPYSFVKQALEKFCERLHKQGISLVIMRPFSGFGADQAESYPFPALLGRALRKEDPLTVWGSTETVRDWIHIDDLTDAILWAIEEGPRGVPLQIGSGIGTRFGDLARMMAEEVGYEPRIEALGGKAAGHPWRVAETVYQPKKSLREAIREAIAGRKG